MLYVLLYIIGICILGYLANRLYFSGARYKSDKRLDGKIAIITGSDTGIGYQTALDFARRGARVYLASRDTIKAEKAVNEIRNQTGNKNVDYEFINLADLDTVREFVQKIKTKIDRLDLLVNNAGVMACPKKWRTKQGYEMHFGINHLGHFLLTNLLLDLIKKTPQSRIISLSSCVHYFGKIYWNSFNCEKELNLAQSYCQSKLAIILFTKELARRLEGTGVTAVCLHPGAVRSEIIRNTGKSLCFLFPLFVRIFYIMYMLVSKSTYEGSLTTIYCALDDEVPKYSGHYFSDCAIRKPSKAAINSEDAKRLWDESSKMTSL